MYNFFTDSHCHLNYIDFKKDRSKILQRAEQDSVNYFLSICTNLKEIPEILKIISSKSNVWCTIGVHPHNAFSELERLGGCQFLSKVLEKNLISHGSKVVGLGETGLDYFYDKSLKLAQRTSFESHICLGIQNNIPLIIHTRNAEEDTIDQLHDYKGLLRGIIHCFSGTIKLVEAMLELGFYISISGIVTFKKSDNLRYIVRNIIPLNRLLIETDSPFLAPFPYRGKRNEPFFIIKTASCIANLKGISVKDLAIATTKNFFHLFFKKNIMKYFLNK